MLRSLLVILGTFSESVCVSASFESVAVLGFTIEEDIVGKFLRPGLLSGGLGCF